MKTRIIYKKLQQYAVAATDLGHEQVIFANQLGAKPAKPFITIALRSFRQVGTSIKKETDERGIETNTLFMMATATFQSFSDGLFEASEILIQLASKFNTELPNEIFGSTLARQRTLQGVTAIPTFIDSQLEHRAIFEVEIGFDSRISHKVGLIERIELKNLMNDEEIIIQQGNQ
ncbi:MAG: phage neck terminator protein [Janthinobacterium lividum]